MVGATSGALAAATYFDAPSTAAASGSILDLVTAAGGLVAPTFLIALTHIAVLSGISRTEFFGLAIGFALFAAVTAYGPGGNLFNPALGIGSWMAQGLLGGGFIFSSLAVQLINLIVQALAGALAVLLFQVLLTSPPPRLLASLPPCLLASLPPCLPCLPASLASLPPCLPVSLPPLPTRLLTCVPPWLQVRSPRSSSSTARRTT